MRASSRTITATRSFDARDRDALTGALGSARRDLGFGARARVVAWGAPGSHVALDLDHLPDVSAIVDAGFDVEAIISPPQALALLLEAQRIDSRRSAVAAVALNAHGAAIAIVHHGQVVSARTFDWTLGEPFSGTRPEQLERYLVISQLAPHLQHLIELAGPVYNVAVSSVVMCGSLPDLRSLSMLLIEELDIEVETLDSAELISPSAVPPSDSSASWQLAAAVSTSAAPTPLPPGDRDSADRGKHDRAALSSSTFRHVAGSIAFVMFAAWASMQVAGSAPAASAFPRGIADATVVSVPVTRAPMSAPQPEATMGRIDRVPPPAAPDPVREDPEPRVPAPAVSRPRPPVPQASLEPLPRVEGIAIAGDRRRAIVDGDIVGPGDRVGSRIVRRIDANGVLLREASGREVFVAIRTRKPPPDGP